MKHIRQAGHGIKILENFILAALYVAVLMDDNEDSIDIPNDEKMFDVMVAGLANGANPSRSANAGSVVSGKGRYMRTPLTLAAMSTPLFLFLLVVLSNIACDKKDLIMGRYMRTPLTLAAMSTPLFLFLLVVLSNIACDKKDLIMTCKAIGNNFEPALREVIMGIWSIVFDVASGKSQPGPALLKFLPVSSTTPFLKPGPLKLSLKVCTIGIFQIVHVHIISVRSSEKTACYYKRS
ncbi:hypothetical protein CVT25_004252 [Psilocybe cyanescens]|uniref:Uncharacterized protein n=1 Tax=Psilocybe cyanescens TaxID=93625 RepID=A0A409XDT5_PSICY|nr:hypothetical protein CVT25_004252 [Psilocybe cyanescens]